MSNKQKTRYFTRPLIGHEESPQWNDDLLEKRIRGYHKLGSAVSPILRNDRYASVNAPPGLFRLGFLEQVPEASKLVMTAEAAAYDKFERVVCELMKKIETDLEFLHNRRCQDEKGHNVHTDQPEDYAHGVLDRVELEEGYRDEYRRFGMTYCYNLKYFYPMYALHHMDNELRTNSVIDWGKFHCPCGRGAFVWRRDRIGLGKYENYWCDDDLQCDDFCGEGQDVHGELDDLIRHMQQKKGPMHKAALKYLLVVYLDKKKQSGQAPQYLMWITGSQRNWRQRNTRLTMM
jgi:hypothetical protein